MVTSLWFKAFCDLEEPLTTAIINIRCLLIEFNALIPIFLAILDQRQEEIEKLFFFFF